MQDRIPDAASIGLQISAAQQGPARSERFRQATECTALKPRRIVLKKSTIVQGGVTEIWYSLRVAFAIR